MGAGPGQPQQVVGEVRSHTGTTRFVPPVLHVAFGVLACSAAQNLRTQHLGRGPAQGHGVLQLIAESAGTTCLVKAGLGPQTAGDALIKQPVIHQAVEQGVGRFDLHGAQQFLPLGAHLALSSGGGFANGAGHGVAGSAHVKNGVADVAEQKSVGAFFPGCQVEVDGQGGARVEGRATAVAKVIRQHHAAARVKELASVAGPVHDIFRRAVEQCLRKTQACACARVRVDNAFGRHQCEEGTAAAKAAAVFTLRTKQGGVGRSVGQRCACLLHRCTAKLLGVSGSALGRGGTHEPFHACSQSPLQLALPVVADVNGDVFD